MSLSHLSTNEVRNIVSVPVVKMSDHDRDEMAIPSYLHGNPLTRWLMWKRYEIIARLSKIESGDTVLEFGCGLGLFLPTLADQAQNVIAMDLFPQYAHEIVTQFNLSSKVKFVTDLDEIADNTLDLVVAADVIGTSR